MPLFFFDINYLILIAPAMLLAMWAQSRVRGAYERWSRVAASSGVSGGDLARQLMDRAGVGDVQVESIRGALTDHYDPRAGAVRLSDAVYGNRSLAALGIAAHEVGHVLQDNEGYLWLGVRNTIIPVSQFGSRMAVPLFIGGLLFSQTSLAILMDLGILLFLFAVIFQVITLPVEFDASNRAVALLEGGGYVTRQEVGAVRQVLNAAALTYVAALVMAVMQLLYLLVLRGRR